MSRKSLQSSSVRQCRKFEISPIRRLRRRSWLIAGGAFQRIFWWLPDLSNVKSCSSSYLATFLMRCNSPLWTFTTFIYSAPRNDFFDGKIRACSVTGASSATQTSAARTGDGCRYECSVLAAWSIENFWICCYYGTKMRVVLLGVMLCQCAGWQRSSFYRCKNLLLGISVWPFLSHSGYRPL